MKLCDRTFNSSICLLVASVFAWCVYVHADGDKDSLSETTHINLPATIPLSVRKTVYEYSSGKDFFGDGFRGQVAVVDSKELALFLRTNLTISKEWSKGPLKPKKDLAALEWLEKWISVYGQKEQIEKAVSFKTLKESPSLYYRAEKVHNTSADGFSDVTMWFVLPEKSLVVVLIVHT